MTRQKVKRQLLDQLDAAYSFEAPSRLVEAEFNNIWNQVNRDLEAAGRSFADEETTEEAARADYTKLAERRVRLGLVLAEIGEKAGVQVSDEEMQRALFEFIRRFPAAQQQGIYRLLPQQSGRADHGARPDLRGEGRRPSARPDFRHRQEGEQGRADGGGRRGRGRDGQGEKDKQSRSRRRGRRGRGAEKKAPAKKKAAVDADSE